ncbi:MAG TPA: PPC domain-containing protein [Gemmataceae bacterium]|nr:PPC domain-containing protein [Gemmataceae bacterium]
MRRFTFAWVVLTAAFTAGSAVAQQNLPTLPQPRLQSVFPSGGKAGATVEVSFTGTDLEDPESLFFSHPGLKAEPIIPPPLPAPKVDPKQPAPKQPMPAPKPVITKFKVTIAADTPLGMHDVRLVNKWGVSNPRPFVVGDLPEVNEVEPNNDVTQAQKVELNSVINGVINAPTDVDYFTFAGKKGQRVLLHVAASSIDSRAKPAVEVYDAAGNRLAFGRNYSEYDALADVPLPAEGSYFVRLFEFTHTAGNPDHFYRLTLTTGPWIDAMMPPMLEPGKATPVTIWGRNLPGGQADPAAVVDGRVLEKISVSITAPTDPAAQQKLSFSGHIPPVMSAQDGFEYRLKGPAGMSNAYLLQFARAPIVLETEPNDKPEAAQAINLPCEVAGRIDKRDDRDWYSFTAKKGDTYFIDLFAERLGSPGDFYFTIKPADPKSNVMAEMDDNAEQLHPQQFYTRSSDPQPYKFDAPQDGKYLVMVSARDAGTDFGPRNVYRLRITPAKPDYRLIVMPMSPHQPEAAILRSNGEEGFDVFVWRLDGFDAPITLSVDGLPAGVTCAPQQIGSTQKHASLILSTKADAPAVVAAIRVKGTAVYKGETVVREARPATITWQTPPQQNIPAITRMDRQLVVAVRDKAPFRIEPVTAAITSKPGDKATINLKVTRIWPELKAPIAVQAITVPPGNQPLVPGLVFNNNQPLTIAPDKNDGNAVLQIGANVQPGVYSLVLRGSAPFQFEKAPKAQKVNTGLVQPSVPITVTIVPTQLGAFTPSMANPNVKIGTSGEIAVKVNRAYGYAGEYKLKLVLPKGVEGITVADAVIPAGKDETKFVVQVGANAKPANVAGILIQTTAQYDAKTPITQEVKFQGFNVVK